MFCPNKELNKFREMYEKASKNMIVEKMIDYFPPSAETYRDTYSTQNVFIQLLKGWKLRLDNNCSVTTDLSKVFDCIKGIA